MEVRGQAGRPIISCLCFARTSPEPPSRNLFTGIGEIPVPCPLRKDGRGRVIQSAKNNHLRALHVSRSLHQIQFNFDTPTGLGCGCSSILRDASIALRRCTAAAALQRNLAHDTNLTSTESS